MKSARLSPPTFESEREQDLFTATVLMHYFLDQQDLQWLEYFSKRIVCAAQDTKRGIALEDLEGILLRTTVTKGQRERHHKWAFYQLRSFIEYKARRVRRSNGMRRRRISSVLTMIFRCSIRRGRCIHMMKPSLPPDHPFETIEMREPLFHLLSRGLAAIRDDIPRAFTITSDGLM